MDGQKNLVMKEAMGWDVKQLGWRQVDGGSAGDVCVSVIFRI